MSEAAIMNELLVCTIAPAQSRQGRGSRHKSLELGVIELRPPEVEPLFITTVHAIRGGTILGIIRFVRLNNATGEIR